MICCDIDGLKVYNDTQGHAKGDEALPLAETFGFYPISTDAALYRAQCRGRNRVAIKTSSGPASVVAADLAP